MKKIRYEIEITYDEESDTGYVYFKKIAKGEAAGKQKFHSIRDFDQDGRILGIEILDASLQFPQEIMEKFENDNDGD